MQVCGCSECLEGCDLESPSCLCENLRILMILTLHNAHGIISFVRLSNFSLFYGILRIHTILETQIEQRKACSGALTRRVTQRDLAVLGARSALFWGW